MQISKEYIELLKSLTSVNPSVLIVRDEVSNMNVVRHMNATKDIFYELIAPAETFGFDGAYMGFFAFPEFHDLFSAFDHTSIEQHGDDRLKIVDVDSKDAFTYKTHDRQYIKGTFKAIDPTEPEFVFTMTDKLRANIRSKAGLISADRIIIKSVADEDAVLITMLNSKSGNDYSFKVNPNKAETGEGHVEGDNGERTDLSQIFPASIISKLPSGDYKVEVSSQGLLSFFLKTEGINLSIRATAIDEGV